MAFKTIMSPKSAALYPIRIKDCLITTGQEVKAEDRVLIAETAQGKRIGIKAGETGRVIQAPPKDAILDRRQMILVIETFEPAEAGSATPETDTGTRTETPRPREQEVRREPQQETQREPGQKPERDPERDPEPAPSAQASPRRPAAKSAKRTKRAKTEPPRANAASSSATSKARPNPDRKKITFGRVLGSYGYYVLPIVAIIVIQAAFPGFLDKFFDSGSVSSTPQSGSGTNAGGTTSSLPVVSFPRPQDYAWMDAPEMESLTRMSRDGATRFFDIDIAPDGSVLIVGARYGDGYAFSFDSSHTIQGEYSSSGPVSDGFALYDLFDASRSTLFAFSNGARDSSRIYTATDDLEDVTRTSRIGDLRLENFRILSADRAGNFGMLWGEYLDRDPDSSPPIDLPFIVALSAVGDATQTQSNGGAGRWTINTAELPEGYGPTVSAGYSDAAFWGDPPAAKFITRTVGYKDGDFSIDTMDTIDLDLADLMPAGTFSGWRGTVDGKDVGRFEAVALEYDSGGDYSLYAGQFSGTRGQPLPEHFDVFLDVGKPDAPSTRLVLARNDSRASDGLEVRDVMALPQGGFAVLMREETGTPYTAVVTLSREGAVRSQYVRRDHGLERMAIGPNGNLHLVGWDVEESGKEALYLILRP
ncbi:hypothetical protein [Celeribacter neptunius]|uniref:Uncharacterized protein n=1 Tax=Celeribacter neptunius TaxID=588602 RepID=A0A1I3PEA2_9RHOB|nr:hypothetical protein [Celeribacter neptunius]SFJ19660.1 hypothetical protein SAMN04487991_1646 [Celeribacter neptunius]